jgi:hypothetical protein
MFPSPMADRFMYGLGPAGQASPTVGSATRRHDWSGPSQHGVAPPTVTHAWVTSDCARK